MQKAALAETVGERGGSMAGDLPLLLVNALFAADAPAPNRYSDGAQIEPMDCLLLGGPAAKPAGSSPERCRSLAGLPMVAVAAASSWAVPVEELVLDDCVEKSKGAIAGAETVALLASIASVWAKLLEVGVRGIANAPGMTREVRRGGQRAEEATRSAGVRWPGLESGRPMKVEEERCWSSSQRKGRWVGSRAW